MPSVPSLLQEGTDLVQCVLPDCMSSCPNGSGAHSTYMSLGCSCTSDDCGMKQHPFHTIMIYTDGPNQITTLVPSYKPGILVLVAQ